jgi:hypothetical protein
MVRSPLIARIRHHGHPQSTAQRAKRIVVASEPMAGRAACPSMTPADCGHRPTRATTYRANVTLTEQTLADYADTLAYLGAAIRLYRDTFRRLGLLGGEGQEEGQAGQDGDGSSRPARPASGSRSPAAACRPGRSGSGLAVHRRANHLRRLRQDFQPQDAGH